MRQLALLIPLMLTGLAHAQATATVTTTVAGGPAITVEPGTPVRIAVRIAHDQFSVAGVYGGTIVTDNAGIASNFSTTIPSLPTVNFGSFVGGSRVGASIEFVPLWTGPTPPSGTNPMPVWDYDLTLANPGTYQVNWVSPSATPYVRLYSSVGAFNFTEAQTTYIGATITVLPAPTSLAPLALTATIAPRRRR